MYKIHEYLHLSGICLYMSSTVFILGDVPQEDKKVLMYYASVHSINLDFKEAISELPVFSSPPSGFISFFHCSMQNIISLFQNLPVGTGEKIPLFQKIQELPVPEFIRQFPILGVFDTPLSHAAAHSIMESINRNEIISEQNANLIKELIIHRKQKFQLVQIGTSLSRENNLGELLELILSASRQLVGADAGSVYVRERKAPGGPFIDILRFMVSQNDSVTLPGQSDKFTIPINDNSIAGYVALHGKTFNIDDIETESSLVKFRSVGKEFESRFGYRIKSILALPLKNMHGEVVGVLQLLNKKKDPVVKLTNTEMIDAVVTKFLHSDEDFLQSVASQAAVSIERVQLHESIQALFDGYLNSSIAAIDERDKVTSGHSRRVMEYASAFAEAAASIPGSPFAEVAETPERKRQFEIAALLHDIGKIGVPEYLLNKENRLSKYEMQSIIVRFDLIAFQLHQGFEGLAWENIIELSKDKEFLIRINHCGYLSDEDLNTLNEIKNKTYIDSNGIRSSFLSDSDFESLSVRYGNLTEKERKEINSHAQATYRILSQIPWPRQYEKVPVIASQHHEKLDGSGYPDGVHDDKIMLESKILAVIDIYEALVAQNRPYKPVISPDEAIEILLHEAENGLIDKDVVRFFKEKGIYKLFVK